MKLAQKGTNMTTLGGATQAWEPSPWQSVSYRVREFYRRYVTGRAWLDRAARWACAFLRWQDTSNYRTFALREFKACGYDLNEKTGPNRWIQDNVLELLAVLAVQGHSGSSVHFAVGMFKDLGLFEPLGPITGAADEWQEVSNGMWQNLRCSHVFKDADGRPYDSSGRIFREKSGACYTGRGSRVYITFPYVPTREYVDVNDVGDALQ